ncbi:UNVERIFIED_CONTAM: hypothetical protein FKN15_054532 [Acipenser sinensis]
MRAHHRPSVWWEEVVLHESFSNEQWIETFRVIRPTFDQLVKLVRVDMESSPIHVRTPVPLQKRVGIALYKLLGPLIRQDCAQQNSVVQPFQEVAGCIADPAWQWYVQSDGTSFCTPGTSDNAPGSAATAV